MSEASHGNGALPSGIAPMLRTAWTIWAALLASAAIHGGVAFVVPGVIAANLDVGTLTTPLVATGFFMAMAGGLLFRRIHRDLPVSGTPGSATEAQASQRVRKALTLMIVAWALFEGAAVVGLVLALLGGKGWPMIAMGFGLMAIHPPRRGLLAQVAGF